MEQNLSFSQLLETLSDLVDNRASGTLYIRSACNHAVTIGLDNGRIFALFYGARRGRSAIPLFHQIQAGSYRLEASALTGVEHDLPPTREILEQLRSGTPAGNATTGGTSTKITPQKRELLARQLRTVLTEYLGPIADWVFDEAIQEAGDFCATPEQAHAFIDTLARDIDDESEEEQFRHQAWAVFGRVLAS